MYALTVALKRTHPCDHEGAGLGRLYKRKAKPYSMSSCKFSFVQERRTKSIFILFFNLFCKHEDEIGGECSLIFKFLEGCVLALAALKTKVKQQCRQCCF